MNAARIIAEQPEWRDESTANSLLAEGAPKEVNPTAWRDRHRFWTNVVKLSMKAGAFSDGRLTVSFKTLEDQVVAPDGRKPKVLRAAMEEAVASGEFIPLRVLASEQPQGIVGRARAFAWDALVNLVWGAAPLGADPLVLRPEAEACARRLHQEHLNAMQKDAHLTNLLTFEQLSSRYGESLGIKGQNDIEAVTSILVSKGLATVGRLKAHRVIKFLTGKHTSKQIIESELAALSLRMVIETIEQREHALSAEIDQLYARAVALSTSKADKETILLVLKRKRLRQDKRKNMQGFLHSLEQELLLIQMAELNAPVLSAMTDGTKALRSLLKEDMVESVESVADELADLADKASEIDAALARAMPTPEVDEDDLEADFAALMPLPPTPLKTPNAPITPSQMTSTLPTIPSVPTTPLMSSPEVESPKVRLKQLA